jgi:hypothetical protein
MHLVLPPLFSIVATAYPTALPANNKELESSSNTAPVANSWNYDPSDFNEIQAHDLFTGEDAECVIRSGLVGLRMDERRRGTNV